MCTKVGELVTVLDAPSVETVFSVVDDKAESLSTSFREGVSIACVKTDCGDDSVGSFCRMRFNKIHYIFTLKLTVQIVATEFKNLVALWSQCLEYATVGMLQNYSD